MLGACTYTSAVTQTNIPQKRDRPVKASIKKYIFLGLNFDNDEILHLAGKLRKKCPGGTVRGILTKDLRTFYVGPFFWARETIATGFCLNHATADHSNEQQTFYSMVDLGDELHGVNP